MQNAAMAVIAVFFLFPNFFESKAQAQDFESIPARAKVFSAHPGEDLQAIVDDACQQGGGIVELEAGTYDLDQSLILWCDGLTLKGAGKGLTELVWKGIDGAALTGCPKGGPRSDGVYAAMVVVWPSNEAPDPSNTEIPVSWPCQPPQPFRLLENVKIEHITLRREVQPSVPNKLPTNSIGAVWTNNLGISHVQTSGFAFGIWTAHTDNLTVKYSQIDALSGVCLVWFGIPAAETFGDPPVRVLDLKPHSVGADIHHNDMESCTIGLSLSNAIGMNIHHNVVRGRIYGVVAGGGEGHQIHANLVTATGEHPDCSRPTGNPLCAAFSLRQVSDSNIHHNTVCASPRALSLRAPVKAIEDLGFPLSSEGDAYHHNQHYGVTETEIVLENGFLGEIQEFKNESFATEPCPNPPSP